MLDDGRRSVPIVEDGRLVGIISRDILRCAACRELVTHTASPFAATGARGVRVRVA
jgi:CBS domain-containing protein